MMGSISSHAAFLGFRSEPPSCDYCGCYMSWGAVQCDRCGAPLKKHNGRRAQIGKPGDIIPCDKHGFVSPYIEVPNPLAKGNE